jgi:hypothetical protein
MNKDKLRALTLGSSKKFERKLVEIDGEFFEVRQPTLKERGLFRKKAMKISQNENGESVTDFDIFAFQIEAVLTLTLVPDSDEKVFEETDREAFESCPCGGWFDKLAAVASELCNVKDAEIKKDGTATK